MKILKRNNLYYLGNSFRKSGKVTYREIYLGKNIPANIENIKENFLRKCMEEELFKKLNQIKKDFKENWNKLPESIKKKELIDLSIKFTYNTNAIENSTITLDETEDLIKNKISPNKTLNDVKETINHSKVFFKAINEKNLNFNTIMKWHKELFFETNQILQEK